jgi:hypothetical protein
MKYKKSASLGLILSALSTQASADIVRNFEGNSLVYTIDDEEFIRFLPMSPVSQPTNNTCGATNTRMLLSWITKKEGSIVVYNIESLYSFMNTNGVDGVQTNELKKGISDAVAYTNKTNNMSLDIGQTEIASVTPADGVTDLKIALKSTENPTILYGNVKDGNPGMHYYSGVGVVDCSATICGSVIKGMFLHDSVYNSTAYTDTSMTRINALKPFTWIRDFELDTYWKKTGSAYPWKKKHYMLSFPATK